MDQINAGLLEEVTSLLNAGVDPQSGAFSSIGYRQLLPYVRGEITLSQAIERIQYDCHRLVRHQETWWRKNPRLIRIDMQQDAWVQITPRIDAFLHGSPQSA